MEDDLWYLLAGTRGSENRTRIVRALDAEPRNANRVAERLDLDYNTVRHHLDTLCEHDVVRRAGDGYGVVYQLTDRFEAHRDTFEHVLSVVDHDLEPVGDGREPVEDGSPEPTTANTGETSEAEEEAEEGPGADAEAIGAPEATE